MKRLNSLFLLFFVIAGGCTAPHYIWKQEDVMMREINQPSLEQKVLIASRDSEFKQALVDKITAALADRSIYIKIIGIENLADENAGAYSAVVIINTAMGWTVDVPVEKFLKKYGTMNSIIVLTTADGGDVLPDMDERNIDAMSSASVMDQVEPLADTIIAKVNRLVN
ncbi:hypothetical protein Dvar_15360 [Desulfosarcina variabilis str. Montpellier]|uniref:hypothetical protein n=1 Tax=Desulfosarcina variabilis TaxID=2300 RepID=UPI003AFAA1B3